MRWPSAKSTGVANTGAKVGNNPPLKNENNTYIIISRLSPWRNSYIVISRPSPWRNCPTPRTQTILLNARSILHLLVIFPNFQFSNELLTWSSSSRIPYSAIHYDAIFPLLGSSHSGDTCVHVAARAPCRRGPCLPDLACRCWTRTLRPAARTRLSARRPTHEHGCSLQPTADGTEGGCCAWYALLFLESLFVCSEFVNEK